MPKDLPVPVTADAFKEFREGRTRVALESVASERARASVPMSRERKQLFLDFVSAGMGLAKASRAAGISNTSMWRERRRDPKFEEAVVAAMEASCEPIEDALEMTALMAPVDSMARVQAAKVLLGARSGRYAQGAAGGASVKMSQGADGTNVLSIQVGTPLPD